MKIKNLSKIYKNKYYEVKALDNINIDFGKTGFVFILGESGSGKSTLLNMIAGIDKPTNGSILVGDKDITKFSNSELDKYRNNYISLVFQEYNLIPELNVIDNINLAVNDIDKSNEALKLVGLENYKERKIYELSGGQKQRVTIARSLSLETDVLLLDEPTAALDSKTSEEIIKLLKEISKSKLVIAVTHNREIAYKYNDRIIEIADGRIINDNNKIENSEDENIEFKKCRLSLKAALKLSINNLKKYLFKVILSIILMVLSLTLLGISLNLNFIDVNNRYFDSLFSNNIEFTTMKRVYTYQAEKTYTNPNDFFSSAIYIKEKPMTNELIASLEKNELKYIYSSKADFMLSDSISDLNTIKSYSEKIKEITEELGYNSFSSAFYNFCTMNYDDMDSFNIKLECGRLPKNENEIVISKFLYNFYELISFNDNGNKIKVSSYDDVLNKEIYVKNIGGTDFKNGDKKIVGIFNSDDVKNRFLNSYVIVSNDCVNESFDSIEIKLEKNNETRDFLTTALAYKKEINENENKYTEEFHFYDNVSNNLSVYKGRANFFKSLSLFLSIFLLIITAFIFLDIISSIILENISQFGILTALGIKKMHKYYIYFTSTLIFILLCFIPSIITIEIFTNLLNLYICDSEHFKVLLTSNIFSYLIIVFFLLLIGFIITAIPLIKQNKFTPIEIMNRG